MSLKLLMVVLLLLLAFISGLGLYIQFARKQASLLIQMASENLWPRRWLIFVYIPFIGRKIIKTIKQNTSLPTRLRFSASRESETDPAPIQLGRSNWILFEEQYDRKTSAHHGTKINLLNKRSNYQFATFHSIPTLPIKKDGIIYVEMPRPMPHVSNQFLYEQDKILWANLHGGEEGSSWWILENLFPGTVIPVIYSRNGQVGGKMINGSESLKLESLDKFCVGLSEFQLVQLPPLAVFCLSTESENNSFIKGKIQNEPGFIDGRVSFGCGQENFFRAYTDNEKIKKIHWHIMGGELYVNENAFLEYTSISSGIPVDYSSGARILLMPGDRFRVVCDVDLEYRFFVDYVKE